MSHTTEPRSGKKQLPYDIVLNILGRLQVKSVIRFRCVCKFWDSLITSPDCFSVHLNNNINKDDGHRYIIHKMTPSPVCTVALDRTFDRISEVGIPFHFPSKYVQIVGSCNGLLCLADFSASFGHGSVIYLWNPSIRKFKRLPEPCLGYLRHTTLGFAYHSENNDYKVVRIQRLLAGSILPLPPPKIEAYTLSLDSWRRVGIEFTTNIRFYNNFCLPIPFVSGALHWMAIIEEVEGEKWRKSEIIMSFDVNREKFKRLAQPDGFIKDNSSGRCLASFKGKLAFIACERTKQPGFQCSIWVMREYGAVESWIKFAIVPLEREAFGIAFTEYGSLLIRYKNDTKYVLIDTENLHEKESDIQQPLQVATFIESLALLDGANTVSY